LQESARESAKQAQQVKPAIKLESKPVEAKPAEVKPVEIKQPAAKAVPEKVPEIKPTARKDAPLPPEDAPDFFERMLEKIGF